MEKLIKTRNINRIAIPAIFAGIAEPILSLTDLAIISNVKVNPTEVLSAVGVVGSFISAIIWILAQSKTSISTTVAQKSSSENIRDAKILFPQIVFVNLIVALTLLVLTQIFTSEIFKFYNLKEDTLNYAIDYYKIRSFGIPITLLTFSLFGVFRGLQNTSWALIISLSGGLINLILDYFLIHGYGDFEGFHIKGAAYASIIAQFIMLTLSVIYLYKKTEFKFKFIFPFHNELKSIILFSSNLFIRTLALNFVIYFTNRQAALISKEHLAAHTILINLWLFSCFFIDGYSNAGNAISGKLISLGKEKIIKVLWKKIFKFSILLATIMISVFIVFKDLIINLFTKDSIVLPYFYNLIPILLLLQILNAFTFSLDGIGKGLGKGKALRNSLIFSTFFVFLPLNVFFNYLNFHLIGIWIAFCFWMLSRGIILYKQLFPRK